MQIQETLSRLDTLLHQCKLDEAEVCLTQAIAQAQAEQDMESEKLLRNEQIGFYRDCGKFPQALGTAAKAVPCSKTPGTPTAFPTPPPC